MTTTFIDKDGYLNVANYVSLAKEIDKVAAKEQWKPAEIYFAGKVIPKYDREKAKAGGAVFEAKRAQVVKIKKRMPAAGSRMKMVVLLRLYKGIEDTEYGKEVASAIKAINQHNKVAEKAIARIKAEKQKVKEVTGKEFDKNLKAVEDILAAAGVKRSSIAIGQSAMGKSMVVRLPNGGYISIGKADSAKFQKAKEPASEKTGPFGRKKTSDKDEKTKSSSKTKATGVKTKAKSSKPSVTKTSSKKSLIKKKTK